MSMSRGARGDSGSRGFSSDPSRSGRSTGPRVFGDGAGVLTGVVMRLLRIGGRARGLLRRGGARAARVVTPLGWLLLLASPLVVVAGFLLGWVEFIAVGWAGCAISVIGLLHLIGRPRIRMGLELPHRRVAVGDDAGAELQAWNPSRVRSLAATVEVPVGDDVVELAIPGLAPAAEHRAVVELPTARRGVIEVGPVRSVRADPIGLVRRELVWTETAELIVHPRTVGVPSTSTGLVHDLEGAATRELSVSDLAFHALRDYQPGDERRYIHWKSSAKTGNHMVRQFEQSRRSHLAVALSLDLDDYADAEEFELAVSVTGSLGVRAIRDGRDLAVAVSAPAAPGTRREQGMRPLATHRPDRLLDDLARIELRDDLPGLRDLVRAVADGVQQLSLAFVVCGSRVPSGILRRAAAAFPVEAVVVAVVCDPTARPGLRHVAGVDVISVGVLDDLRATLSRAAALR